MPIVKTSVKGQVVIPAEMRARTGLKPGGKVRVTLRRGDAALIQPLAADPIAAAFGMLSKSPPRPRHFSTPSRPCRSIRSPARSRR